MTEEMTTFHGKEEIKQELLNRLQNHYDKDEIQKGFYWENGKGCAVGCTIQGNSHIKYETELGIPACFAYLEDGIFEGLRNSDSKQFPIQFIKAIPVGIPKSVMLTVKDRFLCWLLSDESHGVIKFAKSKQPIQEVADLYKKQIEGKIVSAQEWKIARGAAGAYNALGADAYNARGAAYNARGAAYNTRAAAYNARAAAYARAVLHQKDKLLELLSQLRENHVASN